MKNFILRLFFSYLICVLLGAISIYFLDDKYAGFYGKEGGFLWSVILLYPIEALIGTIICYFLLAFISNKKRLIYLIIMFVIFSVIIFRNYILGSHIPKNLFIGIMYYVSILGISQFIIPNYHNNKTENKF